MIASLLKYTILGLVLIVSILANPGDRIPNHPNCPEFQGPLPVYFVHPTNCSRFYECRQKDAWEFECAAGLHFNSKIDVCDYPQNAQCEPQSTTTTTNPPTTLVSSTTTPPTTTSAATTTSTTPVPTTTTSEATPATTPSTTPVSTTTTSEVTPTHSPTTPEISTTNPTPSSSTSAHPPSEASTSAYPTPDVSTTTLYTTPETPATTSATMPTVTTTYRPPSETTPLPNCPPFGATQPNYWSDNSDCSRYLGCLENCIKQFKCPDGLYWNNQQKRCDSFANSQCCPVIPPAPNEWTTTTVSYY